MTSVEALDPRSPYVFDTHELGRRVGALKEIDLTVPAPADLGSDVIGVPSGSPLHLEFRLEEVGEGVLVTGTASAQLRGVCGRCLEELGEDLVIDLQELFVHPGPRGPAAGSADDEATSHLVGELLDLEPLLRDQMVLDLPYRPVCRPDCQGLCSECGANLNDAPEHRHEAPVDPRWAGLSQLQLDEPTT